MKKVEMVGISYNGIIVLEDLPNPKRRMVRAQCFCGNVWDVAAGHLRSGHTTSCGCYKPNKKHYPVKGDRHNRLVIIEEVPKKGTSRYVRVVCECGKDFETKFWDVLVGRTKSCGCFREEYFKKFTAPQKKHGHSSNGKRSVEYTTWKSIKGRCYNKNNPRYSDWGGRGIRVCDRWLESFENFFEDMGERPANKSSIDRIDVNGDYEPSNCRWSDHYEQANNKRPK